MDFGDPTQHSAKLIVALILLAFLAYNLLGGFAWVVSIALAGFFIGSAIPGLVGIASW